MRLIGSGPGGLFARNVTALGWKHIAAIALIRPLLWWWLHWQIRKIYDCECDRQFQFISKFARLLYLPDLSPVQHARSLRQPPTSDCEVGYEPDRKLFSIRNNKQHQGLLRDLKHAMESMEIKHPEHQPHGVQTFTEFGSSGWPFGFVAHLLVFARAENFCTFGLRMLPQLRSPNGYGSKKGTQKNLLVKGC